MKELTAKRFVVKYQGKRLRATLPEALYDDLYLTRNLFLHGSPVSHLTLRYRHSAGYIHLLMVAPVLFSAALVAYLDEMGIAGASKGDARLTLKNVLKYMRSREGFQRVEKGLVVAGRAIK